MKKLLLCLLIVLMLGLLTACDRNSEPTNIFNAITFVSDYNTAAATTGAPLLNLADLEPIISDAATAGAMPDSLVAPEGILNTGALTMQPNRIWVMGRPNSLEQATAEYTALVAAAAGLSVDDAASLVNQLLSTEESEFSVVSNGIRFTINVTEGNIVSLTAEAE